MFNPNITGRRIAAIGLAVAAIALVAQDVPTYKVNVKVVNVLATVRDKKGKIVNNLSQNDFTLDEDGRPQTIKYFTRDTDLPLTLGLLVDTSRSQRQALEQERSASGTFVDSVLRENKDAAFLIHFDHEVELLQDLTKDPQKVSEALSSVSESPEDQNSGNSGGGSNGGGQNGGGYPGGGRHGGYGHMGGGTLLYDSIFLAADELMSKQQGRKAVVVLTDGVDHGSKVTIDRAIESAQRADTIVYSIYFEGQEHDSSRGFGNGGGGGGHRGGIGFPGGGWPGGGGGWPGGGGGGGRRPGGGGQQPREAHVDGKKILERISKETGGRMFEVSKKQTVGDIYKEIQDELRNQYNIGYTPDKAEGEDYRKITLKAKQSDLTVQARDGYYPAKPMEAKGGE